MSETFLNLIQSVIKTRQSGQVSAKGLLDLFTFVNQKLPGAKNIFMYVHNSADPDQSLLNYKPEVIGEKAYALSYYADTDTGAGLGIAAPSMWEAYELTGGSPDNTDFNSSHGFTVQGTHAKWRLIQTSRTDIASVGIKADGESTNQISRLERIIQATALNRGTLAGQGVLMVNDQIDSTDCFLMLENLRLMAIPRFFGYLSQIKGGTAAKDAGRLEMQAWGTPNGGWGTPPMSVRRRVVTFNPDTDTVTDNNHGRSNGSLVRFESQFNGRTASGSGMADGVSSGTWYRIKNATTNTYQLGTLVGDTLVNVNAAEKGTVTAYYGGKRLVTASVANPTVITDTGHGLTTGAYKAFYYHVRTATGTVTPGSNIITDLNFDPTGAVVGTVITGSNIPGGTTIAEVLSTTSIRISNNATGSAPSTVTLTIGALPTGLTTARYYKITVIDANTYSLQSILDNTNIAVTFNDNGVLTAEGQELEFGNVNPGVTAFRVYADSSGSSRYVLHPSYCGKGVVLEGNTEKEKIEIHAVGCYEILSEMTTKSSTVTFDHTTDKITWTSHGLPDDAVIQFGGDVPVEIFEGEKYKIINKTTNDFQITKLDTNTVLTFTSNGTGTITAIAENGSSGGSADTNKVEIMGTRCSRLYTPGIDNTARVEINFEAPVDLGRKIMLKDGVVVPDPRIYIKNGKSSFITGNLRTHNGALYILVDRDGTNYLDGTDSAHFDNLRFTDNCYGTLLFARKVQKLTGRIYSRNCHNARVNMNDTGAGSGIGNIPAPSVWLGQVYSGDFGVTLTACDAREGLRIGDAVNNLYPRNWDMGMNTIIMNFFNPRTEIYPLSGVNALVIEKMVGGTVPFNQIEGNIALEAGCSNVRIEVPDIWPLRYSLTADPAATATIVIKGSIAFNDIAFQPWLRNGIDVVVESLSDRGGASARYVNGKWIISGYPLVGVPADFASISHNLNTIFKRKGQIASDGTRLLVATGDAVTNPWTYFDGSNANSVAYQTVTNTFVARMSTAPSTARKNVYDKLFYDLNQAGLLSGKLILLYILGAHEESTALLNLISTNYNLTKNGSPVFTLNRGFTGTGITSDFLATGYDATVAAEGLTQNGAHSGVFGLTNASSAAGDILGSANGRMAIKIASGGSSYAKTNTSSNAAISSPLALPRHVMGNRSVSTTHTVYDNGVLANTLSNASTGLPDAISILKGSTGATLGQAFAAHVGLSLTQDEITALYNALKICYNGIVATS